jgi:hypothetical protein
LPPRRPRAHRLRRSAPVSSASPCLLSPRPQAYSKEASQALGTNSALHPDSLPEERKKKSLDDDAPLHAAVLLGVSAAVVLCADERDSTAPAVDAAPNDDKIMSSNARDSRAPSTNVTCGAVQAEGRGHVHSWTKIRPSPFTGVFVGGGPCGPPHSSGRSGAQGDATLMVPWNPCPDPHSMSHAKT